MTAGASTRVWEHADTITSIGYHQETAQRGRLPRCDPVGSAAAALHDNPTGQPVVAATLGQLTRTLPTRISSPRPTGPCATLGISTSRRRPMIGKRTIPRALLGAARQASTSLRRPSHRCAAAARA